MTIKPSTALRNEYLQISSLARETGEPIFITNKGQADGVYMSIEAYEALAGRLELYGLIQEGLEDAAEGKARPLTDAMADIRSRRGR